METIDASFLITLKHTNLLTSSNNPGSKYKKAQSLNIQILSEDIWLQYIQPNKV
ncbi:hypothetical protein [Ehrlichia ruminantium]|uniref:hypothetical protein n=1 Tax=Ehrlichia ruminantium TaxID=779 RepID=UPI000A6A9DCB|nr:hypothetical protein [Ehrlichia ruminantium]